MDKSGTCGKLIELNEYELERNARKPCVARNKFLKSSDIEITKKHHSLSPRDLKKGFGLHTISSLELAIRRSRTPKHVCVCDPCDDGQEEAFDEKATDIQPSYFSLLAAERLKYLMGLPSGVEEEVSGAESVEESFEEAREYDVINGTSESMRRAQRYLREHKIFEFFQFLIAHLLAECPFDPIMFLINLLDKCLIYRSGICDPPLLYNKQHIDCLFNLMDRMRTGFIDYDQYKTVFVFRCFWPAPGMFTLGIKSYNPKPPMNDDRQVTKLFFIEEGYECLKDLLNDMIRKRSNEMPKGKKMKTPKAPPPSITRSICPSDTDINLFV